MYLITPFPFPPNLSELGWPREEKSSKHGQRLSQVLPGKAGGVLGSRFFSSGQMLLIIVHLTLEERVFLEF